MQINSCVTQAPPSGAPGASTLSVRSPLPTPRNTCGPTFLQFSVSYVLPLPRLVPECPRGTPSLSQLTLVSTGFTLPLRPFPEFPTYLGPGPQALLGSVSAEARDCGKKPEPSEERRPAPFPHIPWASAPNSVHPPPAVPATSSLSPLCALPKACGPLPALNHHPVFIPKLAWSGLPVSLGPRPQAGQGLSRPAGVSVAMGRPGGFREGGREGEVTLQ